ncbi:hypothetical protein KY361_03420 [Candidatus Woesearchaeota archaeon]|nr:hypothetical protein [Candidatus Woesearchaeota archaeon]
MFDKTIQREKQANEYNGSVGGYVARALLRLAPAAPGIGALVTGAACDNGNGGHDPLPPVAAATAAPDSGPKPLNGVVIDASGSDPVEGIIEEMRVDVDGDGTDDYTESPTDLAATVDYPVQGDYRARVTVVNSSGLEDSATVDIDVGYGNDNTGAAQYIDDTLTNDIGYTCSRDQNLQIPDLRGGAPTMHAYVADVKGTLSDETLYVIYNLGQLTADDLAIIAAYNAEMQATGTPVSITVVNPDDSPDDIRAYFGLAETPKSLPKSSGSSKSSQPKSFLDSVREMLNAGTPERSRAPKRISAPKEVF